MAFDFGNVPDWIQAVGTSGALIYLAVQHHFDRRKTREARDEAERARRDAEAAQARQIVITYSWGFHETVGCFLSATVLNDSDRLIRQVALMVVDDETGDDGMDRGTPVDDPEEFPYLLDKVTAGGSGTMRVLSRHQPVTTLDASRTLGYYDREEHASIELEMRYTVSVVFTDASGLIWRQRWHGYPERLTSWTPPPNLLRKPSRGPDANTKKE